MASITRPPIRSNNEDDRFKVTAEFLEELGACSGQINLFSSVFPTGALATIENAELAISSGLRVGFLFRTINRASVEISGRVRYLDRIVYYRRGIVHRDESFGPAIIYRDGTQVYYNRGLLHRIDDAAVIYPDGRLEFWVRGEFKGRSGGR